MNNILEMYRKVQASVEYARFIRFTTPLKEHLNINHFAYYKITDSGDYSFVGTNPAWHDYCIGNGLLKNFKCLKHPHVVKKGINLMKADRDEASVRLFKEAWDNYKINFNVNIVNAVPGGVEAFSYASSFNDPHADERIINNIPLLQGFMKVFKDQHKKLFKLLDDNQVNIVKEFGDSFYEKPNTLLLAVNKDDFLKELGFSAFLTLSEREKEVLSYLTNGFSAIYIANEMHLSKRTVESHLDTIKSKLYCESKVDLICKAKELANFGYFQTP